MPLSPGTRLGPYEIQDPIGAGGMGEVYRARDTRLERIVAIKVLPTHLSERPDLKERFDREAKAISSLNHPHICALYDVGHQDGVDFLVMEYLEGETLADRLLKEPLPTEDVLRTGLQIAEALDKAHRSGVVHRDLKPGNVMLTREGVKLLDFGLAKLGDLSAKPGSGSLPGLTAMPTAASPQTPLTQAGTILGTFQYMSPEQLEGKEADTRSDIFAFGAMLYEMATGRRAFEGESQASLIASILKEHPRPISEIHSMSPPALDQLVRSCLVKNPDERIQTAHDVGLQLRWIAEGGSAAGVPAPVAARRRRSVQISWVVAALAVAACGWLLFQRFTASQEDRGIIRFQIQTPPGIGQLADPRISPDGKVIAFAATDSTGVNRIWIRRLDDVEAHPLPGTDGSWRPFWSPDSRHLGFITAGGKVKKVSVAGGPPQVIGDVEGEGYDGTWGSAGTILFDATVTDSIRSITASGGVPTQASRIDRSRGETGNVWPYFLPDGKQFLFLAFGNRAEDTVLKVGKLGSLKSRVVGKIDSRIEYVPPGYLLYVRSGALLAQPFDAGKAEFTGEPVPVAENVNVAGVGSQASFSASRNGVLTFWAGANAVRHRLVWVDRTGKELQTLGDAGAIWSPALSPDGTQVVVENQDPRSGQTDLWLKDLERGTTSRFTFEAGSETDGNWSPDGTQIAFAFDGEGNDAIYRKAANGIGQAEVVYKPPYRVSPSDWSRDGRWIAFTAWVRGSGSTDVMAIPADGKGDSVVVADTEFPESNAKFSPDGRWVAYQSRETGRWEVYVQGFPESRGKWQVSTQGGVSPQWRGDGHELYYLDLAQNLMAVEVLPGEGFRAGIPGRLFEASVVSSTGSLNRFAPSRDGSRFLVVTPDTRVQSPPVTVVVNWDRALRQR